MNNLPSITSKSKISRYPFAAWGFILFAIKYNLDRLIASLFGKNWSAIEYLNNPGHISINELTGADQRFYMLLILFSVPFISMGMALCLKRLRDAGLPLYLVFLFFIPLINLFFFGLLCILPSKETQRASEPKPAFLDKLIPRSKTGSALFAVGIPVLCALLFTIFSVDGLKEYGWGLFVATPFFIGFSSVLFYAYHHQPVKLHEAVGIGLLALTFYGLLLLVLAFEGIICLAMAFPIGMIISCIGAIVGCAVQALPYRNPLRLFSFGFLFIPFIMVSENYSGNTEDVFEVKTSVVIDRPPQQVWNRLIAFNEIAPPTEFLFKSGIAYPINAEISGSGVGAIRHCNFTTGSFVEPITTWDEPHLLKFDVLQQPVPMTELSFYKSVHAPHLEGYFASQHGQFLLKETADHKTILEGTTWYKNKMWPESYWKLWSDYILHKIHNRVLNHIKKETEGL